MELHRFLARRMHRPQDIEDLVQEVYIRLLKMENADFVRNPRAYIMTIAANVANDFMTKARRTQDHLVVDSAVVEHVSENPSDYPVDRLASQISTQKQLSSALAKLPPIHQAVLLMHARDGYKYEEIAARLKVSVHQVERYLASAKQALMEVDWGREGAG